MKLCSSPKRVVKKKSKILRVLKKLETKANNISKMEGQKKSIICPFSLP